MKKTSAFWAARHTPSRMETKSCWSRRLPGERRIDRKWTDGLPAVSELASRRVRARPELAVSGKSKARTRVAAPSRAQAYSAAERDAAAGSAASSECAHAGARCKDPSTAPPRPDQTPTGFPASGPDRSYKELARGTSALSVHV